MVGTLVVGQSQLAVASVCAASSSAPGIMELAKGVLESNG